MFSLYMNVCLFHSVERHCIRMIVPRYDESLWKGAIDLSGRTLRSDCVRRLLERGITVARLARAEVNQCTVLIFTARCYASAVLAMGLCLSVCVCVCLSQVGVLLKRLNIGSHKQHRTIAQGL